ncbi:MAG: hypothetical protein KGP12_01545 [Actinomycetales bacterium]|nr:hypothetical protein [Actinomycetales bacterium]
MTVGSEPVSWELASDAIALHIGVHKTGTTAIQTALARSREELLGHGVRYPGPSMAHRAIASSALDRPLGWRTDGARRPDPRLWSRTVRKARAWPQRTVISSEFLAEADDQTTRRIVDDVGTDRLEVIITLRNFARILPSAWQQNLKSGFQTTYADWVRRMLFDDDPQTARSVFWRRHRHDQLVERWARFASAERVTVVVIDESDRSGIFASFEGLLGLPRGTLGQYSGAVTNRSLTLAEAEFLRRLNLAVGGAPGWAAYRDAVHDGMEKGLVEGWTPPRDEPRLQTPQWALDRAGEFAGQFADAIEASGVRVIGDLSVLRARLTGPTEPQDPPDALPFDAAIAALLGAMAAGSRTTGLHTWRSRVVRGIRNAIRRP